MCRARSRRATPGSGWWRRGASGARTPRARTRRQAGGGLAARDTRAAAAPQLVQHLGVARRDALLGAEDLGLVLLQVGRHIALRARERLPPLVVRRNAVAVGVRDFDVVAEDLVEADLERPDAGALALARLQRRD